MYIAASQVYCYSCEDDHGDDFAARHGLKWVHLSLLRPYRLIVT